MARKPRVLFVRPSRATFIEQDLTLLRRHYEVRVVEVAEGRSMGNRLRVLWSLFRGIVWADVSYSWFAEVYALWAVRLSRLMGKGSIVVVGGYEVAQIPDLAYGSALDPRKRGMVATILSRASKSIAVSEFAAQSARALSSKSRVEVVYLAVDSSSLRPTRQKEDIVVTVGGATRQRLALKGVDTFAKASMSLPLAKFVVIGPCDPEVVAQVKAASPGVEFTGELPRDEVVEWFDRARVYCQLSRIESFGFALAEAMSMECRPVVSDQGALPEIVGDSGFIVPYGDAGAAADAIRKALSTQDGRAARARVAEKFSLDERERKLSLIIDSMIRR